MTGYLYQLPFFSGCLENLRERTSSSVPLSSVLKLLRKIHLCDSKL
ncbi:MAG: hypothetical protein FD159_826 [Syntrophaceae bacterium]|nr:MAG: hypothetical protein FD159_826 [Syntrophaceae bacterium]